MTRATCFTALVTALVIAATVAASAQQRGATLSTSAFKGPRTPWGDPDLQGTWPTGPLMVIPFERPPDLGIRATLTAEEAEARYARVQEMRPYDRCITRGAASDGAVPPG